jgi:hypothetical protein
MNSSKETKSLLRLAFIVLAATLLLAPFFLGRAPKLSPISAHSPDHKTLVVRHDVWSRLESYSFR